MTGRSMRFDVALGAFFGSLAVALGAFAAHGLSDPKAVGWVHTAGLYAGLHGLALLALAALDRTGFRIMRGTRALFALGVFLFSGSLALMAFGGPHWLGMVTPFGGLAFVFGWCLLIFSACRQLAD
ncbi:MAG TPA: DUF423 domain-containing protein [Caulobacter sp.]|nr:DUF423 domain-containing protein [Caulobacter sp.]